MESVMMDTMYEIPSDDTIEECVVTKAAVDGESEPLTIHDESLKRQNNPGAALWSHRAAFCAKKYKPKMRKSSAEMEFYDHKECKSGNGLWYYQQASGEYTSRSAFAGKSNVGKSSLINGLMNRKSLARPVPSRARHRPSIITTLTMKSTL